MEFVKIPTHPPGTAKYADRILFSVRYDENELQSFGISNDSIDFDGLYLGKDEFNKIRRLWQDPSYLEDFYNKNRHFFGTEYWDNINKDRFVVDTIASAPLIFDKLKKAVENDTLEKLFSPLDRKDEEKADYASIRVKSKYGAILRRFAFRIYAIKIEDGCYGDYGRGDQNSQGHGKSAQYANRTGKDKPGLCGTRRPE